MPQVKREVERLIKLSYPQSLEISEGVREAGEFTQVGYNFSKLSDVVKNLPDRKASKFQKLLETKFPVSTDPKIRRLRDSGWTIGDISSDVRWDVVSYRIGVREIGLNGFSFVSSSAVVTTPIVSPKPIARVALKTDEFVPSVFDQTKPWILYFVSPDDGKTWYQINPLGKPTRYGDGGQVIPRTIVFGPSIGILPRDSLVIGQQDKVTSVRLKIVLLSDPDAEGDQLSPAVHSYQLLLYPTGGLSGGDPIL